ncbi:hypothetical protein HYR53_10660 [Candidatus Acetothermia bacterium]|nr:hypothetical protein [Candidatus Acetothermia bacterium]
MKKSLISTFVFGLTVLFISITTFAQEPCPGVSVKDGDRRTNTNHFAIVRQLSFPDPVKIHALLMSSQLDPAVQSPAQKIELDQYLKNNYSGDPDVIISDDMTTCDDLLLLRTLLKDETYRPYQIPISNTKRKLGLLTRIDLLPFAPLGEDQVTKSFLIFVNATKQNLYFFRLKLNQVHLLIAGEYLTTSADALQSATTNQISIGELISVFKSLASGPENSIIFFDDMNDYAFTEPLESPNFNDEIIHAFTSPYQHPKFAVLHETRDNTGTAKYNKDHIVLWRAPVFVTDSLSGAVTSTDYSLDITTQKDDKEVNQVYGNVSRAFVEFDATKIHAPLPDWLIVLLVILVMALIGSLLYIMLRRRQEKNLGTQ